VNAWSPTVERLAAGISKRLVLPDSKPSVGSVDRQQERVVELEHKTDGI